MSIRLVCFDLDGTLIREIHSAMLPCLLNGKENEHAVIQAQEESGQLDYIEADYLRARLFKGLDEKRIGERFLDIVKPLNCIAETIQRLHGWGMKCIVITVGPKQVAKAAAEIWGFDSYYGSNYETANGKFTGEITEYIDAGSKVSCLIGYCAGEMIQPHECVAVGDGPTDIPVFGYCLKSIAINASAEVAEKATCSVKTENLSDILGFIV
jgi:phosphoserine phosphatase